MSETITAPFRLRAKEADLHNSAHTISYTQYVPVTVPIEAVLRSEFWGDLVGHFMVGNTITVMPVDLSWRVELLVRDVGMDGAKVELIHKTVFDKPDERDNIGANGFHVEWKNIGEKYCVVRDSDKAVVAKGFKKKSDAIAAMLQQAANRAA